MYGTLTGRTNASTLSMRWKVVTEPSAPKKSGPSNRPGHKPKFKPAMRPKFRRRYARPKR
jgi:hypothetical protein